MVVGLFESRAEVIYSSTDSSDAQGAFQHLKNEDGVALLTIPSDFGENINNNQTGNIHIRWVVKGVGAMESIPSGAVGGLIRAASEVISKTLIDGKVQLDPELTLHPIAISETTSFRGKLFEGLSPGQISGALSSQSVLIPLIIMMIIMMSGSQVIQSMGNEKGNKTLETLLTLPIKRSHIAIGKIIGSAIVGLLMASIYMLGFGYYMQSFQFGAVNLAETGLTLSILDYLLLGLSLFLTILAGLSICMFLGTFAKDYKSSQMLMFPLIILVFIPFFLSMFKSFYTLPLFLKVIMFVIPFSHSMMATGFLMFDDFAMVVAGIVYVAAFTIGVMTIVSNIFQSDTILTGRFQLEWLNKLLRGLSWKRKYRF
jgi:ABC-2 type transport system permease protein